MAQQSAGEEAAVKADSSTEVNLPVHPDTPTQPSADEVPSLTAGHEEQPGDGAPEGPPRKQLKLFGFQLSATERTAKRALVGAGSFLLIINGLGLPFILPKIKAFLGAPYVPMKRAAVDVLFSRVLPTWVGARGHVPTVPGMPLAGLRLVDFGAGDGRIVAAAARHGMKAVGYEVNPYLVWWSRLRTRSLTLSAPGTAELRWANAWHADLRGVDVFTMYGRPGDGLMAKVAAKCEAELPRNAAVVSHYFDVPGWERLLVQDVHGLKLYDMSRRQGNASSLGHKASSKIE